MQFDLSGGCSVIRTTPSSAVLAENARNQLEQYVNQQQTLLEQIDKYEGEDWEQKYGSTACGGSSPHPSRRQN